MLEKYEQGRSREVKQHFSLQQQLNSFLGTDNSITRLSFCSESCMSYFRNLADLPCTCPSQCCPQPLIWWMHCNSINWKRIKSWELPCPIVNSLLVTVLADTGSHPHGQGQPLCPVLAKQGPAWLVAQLSPPELGAAVNSHAGLFTAD